MADSSSAWRPIAAKMLIGGEWIDADRRIDVHNPARPREVVGSIVRATEQDVDRAVKAAKLAQLDWGRKTFGERASVLAAALRRVDDDIEPRAILYVRENGRTMAEARGELRNISAQHTTTLELAPQLDAGRELPAAQGRTYVRHVPYGVVVSIVPWNAPVTLACLQIIPALMAGNSVIVKPPATCPLTLIRTIELMADSLPTGLINVVTGSPGDIGNALTTHKDVAKIGFTGSIESARHIMANAAQSIKGITLELGGNDPAIVLDDVDLGRDTLTRMVRGVFQSSGQVCMAIKRFYVSERIASQFIEAFSTAVDEIVVGDGLEPAVTMGPLHTLPGLERAKNLISDAERRGATVRQLGTIHGHSGSEEGYFLRPTVVTAIPDDAPLMSEEQFCPVIPVATYRDIDDAIARANDTHFGLCASVWTRDVDRGLAVARRLEAGTGFVNTHGVTSLNRKAPYGGVKQSGIGRKASFEGISEYMQLQAITTYSG